MAGTLNWSAAWSGLPYYGLSLLEGIANVVGRPQMVLSSDGPVRRLGTKPRWGGDIQWMDGIEEVSWSSLGRRPPTVFLVSGWSIPQFRGLLHSARRAGSKVICMVDNSWQGTLRQQLGRLYYRAALRGSVDQLLVPGRRAHEFGVKLGHDPTRIHRGLYTVDKSVFRPGSCGERDIDFLFAGQFIRRKGLGDLLEALRLCQKRGHSFRVALAGGLREDWAVGIPEEVEVLGWLRPYEQAQVMRRSKVLVLPSRLDHWGVVVLEAAQCGCLLVVSDQVGAGAELVNQKNGLVFPARDVRALADCLMDIISWPVERVAEGRSESELLAGEFSVEVTAARVGGLMRVLACT